jgi:hypothetical protein
MTDANPEQSAAPSAPPPLSYLLGVLVVNLPAAIALGLGWVGAGFLAWLGAFVVGIALGVAWFKVERAVAHLLATFVSSFILPIPVAAFLVTAVRIVSGQLETVPLDEALKAEGSMLAIDDAVVEDELIGERLSQPGPNAGLPSNHFAAPVVAEDWSPNKPVAVWLRCSGEGDDPSGSCEDAWARRPIVGKAYRSAPEDEPSVSDAIDKHGLKASKEVLILRTSASPRVDAWATLGGVGAFWLLVNALVLALLLWRRKAAARG